MWLPSFPCQSKVDTMNHPHCLYHVPLPLSKYHTRGNCSWLEQCGLKPKPLLSAIFNLHVYFTSLPWLDTGLFATVTLKISMFFYIYSHVLITPKVLFTLMPLASPHPFPNVFCHWRGISGNRWKATFNEGLTMPTYRSILQVDFLVSLRAQKITPLALLHEQEEQKLPTTSGISCHTSIRFLLNNWSFFHQVFCRTSLMILQPSLWGIPKCCVPVQCPPQWALRVLVFT